MCSATQSLKNASGQNDVMLLHYHPEQDLGRLHTTFKTTIKHLLPLSTLHSQFNILSQMQTVTDKTWTKMCLGLVNATWYQLEMTMLRWTLHEMLIHILLLSRM